MTRLQTSVRNHTLMDEEDTGCREWEDFHGLFPYRLHTTISLAEKCGLAHIVSWLPCGKLFQVHDQKTFVTAVMPRIGRFTRYKSFLRQLGMYKFERITSGPLKGAYHHPYFRRNHSDLCRAVLRGEIYYPVASKAIRKTTDYSHGPINGKKDVHFIPADTPTLSSTGSTKIRTSPESSYQNLVTAVPSSSSRSKDHSSSSSSSSSSSAESFFDTDLNWPRGRGLRFKDTVTRHTGGELLADEWPMVRAGGDGPRGAGGHNSSRWMTSPHAIFQSTRGSSHKAYIKLNPKNEGALGGCICPPQTTAFSSVESAKITASSMPVALTSTLSQSRGFTNKESSFPSIDIMDEIISTFVGDAYNP